MLSNFVLNTYTVSSKTKTTEHFLSIVVCISNATTHLFYNFIDILYANGKNAYRKEYFLPNFYQTEIGVYR